MPTRYVRRSSGLTGKAGLPNANSIRVDSDTEELKFGYGASGTNEKIVADLDTVMALRARVDTLEASVRQLQPPEEETEDRPEKNRRKKAERED